MLDPRRLNANKITCKALAFALNDTKKAVIMLKGIMHGRIYGISFDFENEKKIKGRSPHSNANLKRDLLFGEVRGICGDVVRDFKRLMDHGNSPRIITGIKNQNG